MFVASGVASMSLVNWFVSSCETSRFDWRCWRTWSARSGRRVCLAQVWKLEGTDDEVVVFHRVVNLDLPLQTPSSFLAVVSCSVWSSELVVEFSFFVELHWPVFDPLYQLIDVWLKDDTDYLKAYIYERADLSFRCIKWKTS